MFKKFISIALAAMVLLAQTAIAYTDVPDTDLDAEAINILTSLGVLEGFEDGSFRPDDTVTRAEAAKIVVLVAGRDPMPGISPFLDVPEDTEGWINTAYSVGIISGYGDACFHPDDLATYEQAVKMIVLALGYGHLWSGLDHGGRYPDIYLDMAEILGIIDSNSGIVGEHLTRRQLSRLLYDSLEVQMDTMSWCIYGGHEEETFLSRLTQKAYSVSQQMPDIRSGPLALFDGIKNSYVTFDVEDSVTVDLGEVKELGLIKLFVREYDDDRSLTLTLEISEDGENWTPAGTETYGGGKGYSSSTELDAQVRYVRVNCDETDAGSWVSLAEMEIYGKM